MTGDAKSRRGDGGRTSRRQARPRSKAAAAASESGSGGVLGPLGELLEVARRPLPEGTPAWFGEIWQVWLDLGIPPVCTPEIAHDPVRVDAYTALRTRINRRIHRNRDNAEATVRGASRTRRDGLELEMVVDAPAWPEVVRRMLALIDEAGCSRVLDLGCGCGGVGLAIARLRPQVEVTLVDCMRGMLAISRRLAAAHGIANVRVVESSVFDDLPPDLGAFDAMVWNKVWATAEQYRRGDDRSTPDDLDDPLLPRRLLEVAEIDQTLADGVRRWASSLAPGGRLLTSERFPTVLGKVTWLRILANAGLAVDHETGPPILATLATDAEQVPAWVARHGTWSPDPAQIIAASLAQAEVPESVRPLVNKIAVDGAAQLASRGRVEFDWRDCTHRDRPMVGLGVVTVQRGWMVASYSCGPMPWDSWHYAPVGGVLVETESPEVGRFVLLRDSLDNPLQYERLELGQSVESCLAKRYACRDEDTFANGPRRFRRRMDRGVGDCEGSG